MTGDSAPQFEQLFATLAPLPPSERRRRLDHVRDPAIRRELESLLTFHDASSLLDEPPVLADALHEMAPEDVAAGEAIGSYRLVRNLGTGGMGSVWLAEQTDPLWRRVAIKLVRRDAAAPESIARFHAERQALALLHHPHIATLLEAGAVRGERPYMVMEYVDGTPITTYARERGLSWVDRLELFLQLCDALRHAHERGVVHRDVKPSNVLVTEVDGRACVKLIDFGVARIGARSGAFRVGAPPTEPGVAVGTRGYMSPEQAAAEGAAVDERSDVYSAGIVLRDVMGDRMPRALRRIVARASREQPAQRYASAVALADDCRRALARGRAALSLSLPVPRGAAAAGIGVLVLAVVALQSLANRPPATPRTLRVPSQHSTIQGALAAARPGDIVLVSAGRYRENLVMKSGIVLESESGPERTVIDGHGRGSVIVCSGRGKRSVIRGFSIVHGAGADFGGGIQCRNGASPHIEGNTITGNSAVHGGAVAARFDSYPTLRGNRIHGNHATFEGGGIYGGDGLRDTMRILFNEIRGNSTGSYGTGGGIWMGVMSAQIEGNVICDNACTRGGGGIWAGFAGAKRIVGNELRDNRSDGLGGAMWVDQGSTLIEDNRLGRNSTRIGPDLAVGNLGAHLVRGNTILPPQAP